MITIGECIHVISSNVRTAIEGRDKAFIQDMARRQVEKGAKVLDLNIGPQKKAGVEVMRWMVETIQGPAYATSIGLLFWGLRHDSEVARFYDRRRGERPSRFFTWLREFLPH